MAERGVKEDVVKRVRSRGKCKGKAQERVVSVVNAPVISSREVLGEFPLFAVSELV